MDTTQRQQAIPSRTPLGATGVSPVLPVGRHGQDARGTRRAITLMEILLVLTILVLIAATTWPSLERSLADQRLRNAADMVRAEWSHARAKAMSSGIAYQFRYTPQERTYWLEPCEDVETPSSESASTEGNGRPAAATESDLDRLQLPEKITFVKGSVREQPLEGVAADEASMAQGVELRTWDSGEPDAPIIFAADGTCLPARLTLRNEYDRGITVTVRGLTAISVVGEVFNVEEQQP